MGQKELNDLLGAVLTADSGSASGQAVSYVFWRVLPLYPTLRSYVKVLLDSPEFFVMFWNSVKITVGVLAGQILVGVPAAWGFSGKKSAVYDLCGIDDDALSGNDAQ